jgi:hypothetical protein
MKITSSADHFEQINMLPCDASSILPRALGLCTATQKLSHLFDEVSCNNQLLQAILAALVSAHMRTPHIR